jgi:hypothetical protein
MPEEIEIPTEQLHEEIQEKAEEQKEKWTLYLALSTALMAVMAAVAALLAGHHANEALIERAKASDQWNFYQSKNLKQEIAISTDQILHALGKTDSATKDHGADIARYEREKADIKKEADEDERKSEAHLGKHIPLAAAVTGFQIAIAISAIAILTRRKNLWYGSLVLTAVGVVFLILGLLP